MHLSILISAVVFFVTCMDIVGEVSQLCFFSLHGYADRCCEMLKERANAMGLLNTA